MLCVKPTKFEPICLTSYEITAILLGGGPEERPSFWKAYRREFELNRKTKYRNYHIQICQRHLGVLKSRFSEPVYFREGRLVSEKEACRADNN